MLKNYFRIAFRNLVKYKSYTLINIAGLSIGIACSIFIAVFVINELSYDKFHKKASQIQRVALIGKIMGQELDMPYTPAPMAAVLVEEYPEVVNATRIITREKLVRYNDKKFNEKRFFYADSGFFDVFTMPLIKGDPKTALSRPESVVLTEETAQRYFGKEDPMGKMLKIGSNQDNTHYQVTGVMKNIPKNSHFHFDLLGSMATLKMSRNDFWLNNGFYTYVLLQKNFPAKQLEEKFPDLLLKYAGPQIEQILGVTFEDFEKAGNKYGYFLQPLRDIHLHSNLDGEMEPGGNIAYVYIFSFIALFILIIACINFMNLATACSANRAKEVGLRKVAGSNRSQLINQFLTESVFLSAISLCLGLIIVRLLFPYFNNLINLQLSINYFENWFTIPLLIALVLFVGFVAGSYPAFFLASFKPVAILKGKLKAGTKSGLFRNILVVFQFSIAIVIFLATFTVYNQVKYMQNKDLGFKKDNVLLIKQSYALGNRIETFKQQLVENPNVVSVCNTDMVPGRNFSRNGFLVEGISASKPFLLWQGRVSPEFTKTLNLKMAKGRFFSPEMLSDSSSIIINEAAVKNLGLTDPVIGKRLIQPGPTPEQKTILTIIGVVKDFNFLSLHNEIEPLALTLLNYPGYYIPVKIRPENVNQTIKFVEKKWDDFTSEYPFEYVFLDDDFNQLYGEEKRTSKLFFIFSFLSIFIACLGLFGLALFIAEQKTKEVGIRKVLGASVTEIVRLMSMSFMKWVLLANVLAWPVAWYFMNNWLQNFAYRVHMEIGAFLFAGMLALAIALVTINFQTIKAARRNPVEALQYE